MADLTDRIIGSFQRGASRATLLDLMTSSEHPESLVTDLLRRGDSEVRAFIVDALPDLVGTATVDHDVAVQSLIRVARGDTDTDNRDVAIERLLTFDAKAAQALVPELERRMKSDDYYTPATAMWGLAVLDSTASAPIVADYSSRMGPGRWQGREAEIVVHVLNHDDAALAAQILSHDHDMTPALCRAALVRKSKPVIAALAECADKFDEECQSRCRAALRQLSGAA